MPAFYGWLLKLDENVLRKQIGDCENVYLDMNSIIHPCCHSDSGNMQRTEEEMFAAVIEEIDALVELTKPRKLLYLGIDGVAPAAKMSQQRERRLRSVREYEERMEIEDEVRAAKKVSGYFVPEHKVFRPDKWDSNVITPGTDFMMKLSNYLKIAVTKRLAENELWKGLNVVVADAQVPGEGEHKILEFIRSQKKDEDQSAKAADGSETPTQRAVNEHCIVGDDADLAMLSLGLHLPRTVVLRNTSRLEDLMAKNFSRSRHTPPAFIRRPMQKTSDSYSAIDVDIFRHVLNMKFLNRFDLNEEQKERAIDDILVLFFMAGNDFLPHLPTLDVRDGALTRIISLYLDSNIKDQNEPKFIVNKDYHLDLENFSLYLDKFIRIEESEDSSRDTVTNYIDQKRKKWKPMRNMKQCIEFAAKGTCKNGDQCVNLHDKEVPLNHTLMKLRGGVIEFALQAVDLAEKNKPWVDIMNIKPLVAQSAPSAASASIAYVKKLNLAPQIIFKGLNDMQIRHVKELARTLKMSAYSKSNSNNVEVRFRHNSSVRPAQLLAKDKTWAEHVRKVATLAYQDDVDSCVAERDCYYISQFSENDRRIFGSDDPSDNMDMYYSEKFQLDPRTEEGRELISKVAEDYIRGMQFVTRYYFDRLPSWTYQYSNHYAPFARDLLEVIPKMIEKNKFDTWEPSSPATPIEQLMAVLPYKSNSALPSNLRPFMTEPDSPVVEMFPDPDSIELDPNGRRFRYQWVAQLPHMDIDKVKDVVKVSRGEWTDLERKRDTINDSDIFTKINGETFQQQDKHRETAHSAFPYQGAYKNVEPLNRQTVLRASFSPKYDGWIQPLHRRQFMSFSRMMFRMLR